MAGPAPKPRWFRCLMGSKAKQALQHSDTSPDDFSVVLAASGGPRWLGLVGIDQALRAFVAKRNSTERLPLLGASSGAWRMAAWVCDDDGQTYRELIHEYIEQRYEGSPTPGEVSAVCRAYIERLFTKERAVQAINHPKLQLNFTTAIMSREQPSNRKTVATLLKGVAYNMAGRHLLARAFHRGHFSALPHPTDSSLAGGWDQLKTVQIELSPENFRAGLMATGSIPTILEGESSISGSPRGHHLDGGILDYHFELEEPNGPVLYPHFCEDPIPGWLDKFPPKRRAGQKAKEHLCLLLPSEELLSKFPTGDYPNRHDFRRFPNDDRIKLWRETVALGPRVESELKACLESGDLARIAEPLS